MKETNQPTRAAAAVNTSTPKEWANPTPAGLVALAAACFCFYALLNGFVEKSAMPLIGCWLLGGFVIQIVVALLDLRGGNAAGGNAFLFFSAFFMLSSGLEMFEKYKGILSGTALDSRIDGFVWIVLAVVIILWTPAFFKTFNLLSLIVLGLDVALPFLALVDLKVIPADFSVIPAYALLFSGIIAIYFSAALVVNTTYGRTKFPVIEKKKN